ncbi:hypothetical protein C8R44DRAFT_682661 [Mycena epipterygia]|nr:hypothetical protein C8R44DRAFT_682661 [Mycena epipterygia]
MSESSCEPTKAESVTTTDLLAALSADSSPTEPTDSQLLTRAPGLWFEDGGLIIRAQTTLFRVSRDVLATHSSIFRDMLFLPSGEDNMMDGCSFVNLPDNAKDVGYFLRALFDYRFFDPYPAHTTFPILSGVLRMSHKYEVKGLLKRGLKHFSSGHFTSLADWQSKKSQSSWMHCGSHIPIISLARQVSAEWIIPLAVYQLCERIKEHQVLEGFPFNDSMVRLDLRDQVLVLKASTFLRNDGISNVLDFLWDPVKIAGCETPPSCTMLRFKIRTIADRWRRADREGLMPFHIWTKADFKEYAKGVCPVCISAMQDAHQRALRSLWDRLPGLCELPAWEELEKRRAAALK